MNKLPWFTHDDDAHEDQFIQDLIIKFGHFGYMAYFIILELLHRHGNGDKLVISKSILAQKLHKRWTQVELYLNYSSTSDKVEFKLTGDRVELQIKKFRERQSKMKSKLLSTFHQPSSNLPQEGEGEYIPPTPLQGGGRQPEALNGHQKGKKPRRARLKPLLVAEDIPGFPDFWTAYPNKEFKQLALEIFALLNPSPAEIPQIVGAAAAYVEKCQRDGTAQKFMMRADNWLNARPWLDGPKDEPSHKPLSPLDFEWCVLCGGPHAPDNHKPGKEKQHEPA